jgi:hypothetical protein
MPESNLLLDQPARVTWVEGMKASTGGKLLPDTHSKDFTLVREGLRFIMETLNAGNRPNAQIHTGDITLYQADIERMYAAINQT